MITIKEIKIKIKIKTKNQWYNKNNTIIRIKENKIIKRLCNQTHVNIID